MKREKQKDNGKTIPGQHSAPWMPASATATLDLTGAAEFLKVHESTVQELAASGTIPGAQIGRAWVFRVSDLDNYLANEVAKQTAARRNADRVEPEDGKAGRRRSRSVPRPFLPPVDASPQPV